ncbi:hypothetical protein Hanom_Chr06g00568511 [Helianthus anomalus]
MIALLVSSWFLMIREFIYIYGGWCPYSWKGLELWYNAVLVLLAGYMANAEVAISAFSICFNGMGVYDKPRLLRRCMVIKRPVNVDMYG